MTDRVHTPADAQTLMRIAMAHHTEGRLAEAEATYGAILAQAPDHVEALRMLSLILVGGPDTLAAEGAVARLLAHHPDDVTGLYCLGQLRARRGDDAGAVEVLRRVIARQPSFAPFHNELGVSLHRLGRLSEASAALGRATALDPAFSVAWGNYGMVLFDQAAFSEAVDALLAALATDDPALGAMRTFLLSTLVRAASKVARLGDAEAAARASIAAGHDDARTVELLARLLDQSKRRPQAEEILNDLARRTGVQRRGPARSAAETILILGAVGAGHVPTRYLIDPNIFTTLSLTLLSPDQPDAPLGGVDIQPLGQAGVVFSTLADAHRDKGQLAAAEAFCVDLRKPILNPPGAIPRTGRDRAEALFNDIPGMVTPAVRSITPDDLAALHIEAPLLVRPSGDHGGDNLIQLRNNADKAAYLDSRPDQELLVTRFHDFRSADGLWRKYRLIFVDRRVYPFHLAIGEDWLVHYWRAEMTRSSWKLAEEDRFLEDWRGVFGPLAANAADEVARRMDLDYAGMDCALTAEGELLLFEANATVLLHLDETPEAAPIKHRHVPLIRDAFTRLVRARAGPGAP